METFKSLEELTHELKKQLYGLRTITLPELEEKIANIGNSADLSDLTSQIDDLKNNVIPALDNKFATIESLQNVESNLSQLDTELETVGSQVDDLTQNVIPALEEKISSNQGSSGGSSSAGEWTVVYDKNSEDAAINWGYPDGICGNQGTIETSVDFMPYDYMRIYYVAAGVQYSLHEFYIRDANDSETATPTLGFADIYYTATAIISHVFGLSKQADGRRLIYIGNARLHNLRTSGYITMQSVATNTGFYISKIEVK